ncbi:glycosyltransferase [archaeon]|jgi:GT2 family glycosyltransferase|nr:glycosyltransferase [archaeon]MBT4396865.1 glycosyltransferase [archaeon]MBT4441457.1 glycosyltransferase [archaeon]
MSKYTIIIPHYNDVKRAKKLIDSLGKQKVEHEAIIVDDYSPLEVYKELAEIARGKVRLIRAPKNAGPATARNIGIGKAEGEYIIFTDSDCIVPENWLELIDDFYSHKDNENKILQGRAHMLSSTAVGESISDLGFPAGASIGFEKIWPVKANGETRQLVTCNCVIPKKVLDKVGLFDTSMPVQFGEDTIMGLNIINNDYKIIYNKNVFIYHPARDSFKSFLKWVWIRGKGAYYFKKKNSSPAGSFIKTRLWSSKNVLVHGLKTIRFPLVAIFLFLYLFLFYLSFITEKIKN